MGRTVHRRAPVEWDDGARHFGDGRGAAVGQLAARAKADLNDVARLDTPESVWLEPEFDGSFSLGVAMTGNGDVLIVVEASGSPPRDSSYELVTAGKKLAAAFGSSLTALLVGADCDKAASQFAGTGIDRLLVADDLRLEH